MNSNYYRINNYKNLGNQFEEMGELEKALEFYKKAFKFKEASNDIDLLLDMGLLYEEFGEEELAKEKFLQILEIDPKEARAYYGLGVLYDERNQYEEALAYYKKAIEFDPDYDRAYFFAANVYDQIGQKEEAIHYYKKVIELVPDDFWAYVNMFI